MCISDEVAKLWLVSDVAVMKDLTGSQYYKAEEMPSSTVPSPSVRPGKQSKSAFKVNTSIFVLKYTQV